MKILYNILQIIGLLVCIDALLKGRVDFATFMLMWVFYFNWREWRTSHENFS